MRKVIYVYHRTDTKENTYKIGKADQRSNQEEDITIDEVGQVRISEQLTAATYGKYAIIQTFDISHVENSTKVEGAIHRSIQLKGFKRLRRILKGEDKEKNGSTEWFDFEDLNRGEVLDLIKTLVEEHAGSSGLSSYRGRWYQENLKKEVLKTIQEGGKLIGAELSPRFGKTLWALDLFKTLVDKGERQYLILPSYWLSSHSSFLEELRAFSDFDDMLFITDKDLNFEKKVRDNVDKKLVIATSLHTPEETLYKYKAVADLDHSKKIAFIDEADFGAHTDASKARIDLLDVGVKIIMTGTAIERALAGYEIDRIVKWSYFDMLLLKDGTHPLLTPLSKAQKKEAVASCAAIVRPNLFKMAMPNAAGIQESLPEVLQTKWSKLLEDVEKSQFILEMILKAMFKNDNSEIHELTSLSLSSVTPAQVTMIFGAFRNKIQHSKFTKLLAGTLGDDFRVLKVNGDATTNRKAEELVKKEVARAKRKGERLIIVSKDMASRSFSIPEVDTVFLMYDRGLLSQAQQKVARALTPGDTFYNENKQEGTIVSLSLDSNRLEADPIDLYIMAETERINEEDESMQRSVRRICNSVNIFQNDLTFGAIEINPDDYATELLQRSSMLKDVVATLSLEQINPSDYLDGMLANRSSNPNQNDDDRQDVDTSNVVSGIREGDGTEREPRTPDEEKQFLKNVIFFSTNITALKEVEGFTKNNVRDLLSEISNKGLEHEVEDFYGLTYDCIERLVETKALPIRLLNTILENHNIPALTI